MRGVLAPLVKLVTFGVITALATGMLALTIANTDFGAKNPYSARFTDASGLVEGDEVRIAGVRVGKVESIQVADRRLAEVRFTVEQGRELPAGVTATIRYRNLVGQRYIELEQGPGSTGEVLPPGGLIPLERTTPALDLTVLFNGFKPLFQALDPQQVNQLSFEIIQVLQGQGATMESLLASTASLTNTVADRDRVVGEVINNLNTVLGTVNARNDELSRLIAQLQQLVSGLAADRAPIGEAISSLDQLASATAGLVGEVRPPLRADVAALGQVSRNLADSGAVVEGVLQRMPNKLDTINRTASYGSWFNFYLCQGGGTITLPDGQLVEIEPYHSPAPRCSP